MTDPVEVLDAAYWMKGCSSLGGSVTRCWLESAIRPTRARTSASWTLRRLFRRWRHGIISRPLPKICAAARAVSACGHTEGSQKRSATRHIGVLHPFEERRHLIQSAAAHRQFPLQQLRQVGLRDRSRAPSTRAGTSNWQRWHVAQTHPIAEVAGAWSRLDHATYGACDK
jgi:hypothetical protein